MEKSVEKANFATGVSCLSENAPELFSEINVFLAQARILCLSENVLGKLGLFMFYHLSHQRDTGSDLTLKN